MKTTWIICAAILAALTITITACGEDSTANSEIAMQEESVVEQSNVVSSAINFEENRGEIVNGIFTATDGAYRVSVPQGVTLLTAANTTSVFSADDGTTTITVSCESSGGVYQDLTQESFESVYRQLYQDYNTGEFSVKSIDETKTDYRLSFTGTDRENPLQIYVCKAVSPYRAVTIQVSAQQNNDHANALLEEFAASLVF